MSSSYTERKYRLQSMSKGLTALLKDGYPAYFPQEIIDALFNDGEPHVDISRSEMQQFVDALRPRCTNVYAPRDPDEFQCSVCGNGLNIENQHTGWEPISFCPFCGAEIVE